MTFVVEIKDWFAVALEITQLGLFFLLGLGLVLSLLLDAVLQRLR